MHPLIWFVLVPLVVSFVGNMLALLIWIHFHLDEHWHERKERLARERHERRVREGKQRRIR